MPSAIILAVSTGLSYWIAFSTPSGAAAIFVALPCICALARVRTSRQAFYVGLMTGMMMYVPHLWFFWSIFGPRAIVLWIIVGFPIATFLLLLNLAHRRLGGLRALLLTPVLWTGVEYFRSEIWHLRFAWLLPGQAAAFLPGVRLECIGVYGVGFLYVLAAAMIVSQLQNPTRDRANRMSRTGNPDVAVPALPYAPRLPRAVRVAGIQLEFPTPEQAADALDRLALAHPEAQILVLSEYNSPGPVPPERARRGAKTSSLFDRWRGENSG